MFARPPVSAWDEMATRQDPWKKIGRPAYEGVHKMPFEMVRRAKTHEANRQRVVAKVLVDLYLMTFHRLLDKTLPISVSGAASQSLFGSRSRETEAAHCAPRQLYIGTERMQDLLFTKFPERSLAISGLFGEADILPKNFNKADSRAEGLGLAEAFRAAAAQVVVSADANKVLTQDQISISVKTAHSLYRRRASEAFRASAKELKRKIDEIRRSKVKHTLRTKEEDKWQEQYDITKVYLDSIHDNEGLLQAVDSTILAGLMRIYSDIP